jgi:hypothetical protein
MPPHWFRPVPADQSTEAVEQTAKEGESLKPHLCKLKRPDGSKHYEIVVSEERPPGEGVVFLVNEDVLVPE